MSKINRFHIFFLQSMTWIFSPLFLIQVMDSSGRIPSQLLSGNSHQLGDYDQCLSIGHATIQPQYCLALVDVTADSTAPQGVKHVVQNVRGNDFIRSHRDQVSFLSCNKIEPPCNPVNKLANLWSIGWLK